MLVLAAIGGIVMLLFTAVLAYVTYTVAVMKSEMVYVTELNKIINEVNSLSYDVHKANERIATRIDNTQTSAQSANSKNVEIDSRIDALLDRIAATERDIASVEDATEDNANDIIVNTEMIETNKNDLGTHGTDISNLLTATADVVDSGLLSKRIQESEESVKADTDDKYVRIPELETKFSDLNTNGFQTSSLRTNALTLADNNGSGFASLTFDSSDNAMSLVSESGNQNVKLGPGGLMLNGALLKVDNSGTNPSLQFCGDGTSGSCRPLIQTAVPPSAPVS
nr:hypothetical protein TetV2_00271 [Oceanusvirus sp.]